MPCLVVRSLMNVCLGLIEACAATAVYVTLHTCELFSLADEHSLRVPFRFGQLLPLPRYQFTSYGLEVGLTGSACSTCKSRRTCCVGVYAVCATTDRDEQSDCRSNGC